METIGRPSRPSSSSSATNTSKSQDELDQSPTGNCRKTPQYKVETVDENEEMAKMEKVFEAFITCDFKVDNLCFEDDFVTNTAAWPGSQCGEDERELESGRKRENYKMESESGNNLSLPTSLFSTNVLGKHQFVNFAPSCIRPLKATCFPKELLPITFVPQTSAKRQTLTRSPYCRTRRPSCPRGR